MALVASAGDARVVGLIPGSGRPPGGGNGNLLQYSQEKRSLADYSPQRCKESNTTAVTEHAQTHVCRRQKLRQSGSRGDTYNSGGRKCPDPHQESFSIAPFLLLLIQHGAPDFPLRADMGKCLWSPHLWLPGPILFSPAAWSHPVFQIATTDSGLPMPNFKNPNLNPSGDTPSRPIVLRAIVM